MFTMFNLKNLLFACAAIINLIYGKPIQEIAKSRDSPEMQIPKDFSQLNNETTKPIEVQKAVCTVISGDVRASAEAFTTRELKDVCSSSQMSRTFSELESKLGQELQNIHQLLQNLQQQLAMFDVLQQNFNESLEQPITANSSSYVVPPPPVKFHQAQTAQKLQKICELNTRHHLKPKLKSLSSRDEITQPSSSQWEKEISNYSATPVINKDVKVYTYYWRVENFTRSLHSSKSSDRESPIFSIKGKSFRIQAHFQHLHRDYLYLQVKEISTAPPLSLGKTIILDTGGLFKKISSDNFKYKISILDQNKKYSSDLVSQEFGISDTALSIPNSALIDSGFVKDDSLLIKLFLYF